ncbi:hypothetical protein PIB30_092584 [Stylosanthes scabra]|uniref:Leucine-rich repeat-containing N-terminal plant-type domain-containing protein n=1 Tax=Stylosanthes scabra TaxID=79078 RepID=A0ABU6VV90_9FABA|nr:hypothetical protein [Stylosanthes scabra]
MGGGTSITNSLFFSSLLLLLSLFQLLHSQNGVVYAQEKIASSEEEALGIFQQRETLEIIIGGGGSPSPAPAPSPPEYTPCPPPPKPPSRLEKARKVLLNFTNYIVDPKGFTNNWCSQTFNTCDFNGIRCATYPISNEPAVAGLDLNQAGIYGRNNKPLSLSGILDRIPELTFFHVNSNNFSSSVPKEIVSYGFFYELDLSNNKLCGQFPMETLQNNNLVFLDLRFNQLTGPIPSKLFDIHLDVIFINNNRFNQYLPENFGNTIARYLTFANNQLCGPIPRSIGKAANTLTEVLFLGNNFDGCLPYEIGNLKKAVVFDVSKNHLTGPIPYSFGCLRQIQFLNLANNKFYGAVPENVCKLPGLIKNGNLTLSNNYFTAVGPECWKLIRSKVLDLTNNCVPGLPKQRSHKECWEFLHSVKPCPNEKYLLSYSPCAGHWNKESEDTEEVAAAPPVTYNALKPHRLRL